MRYLLVLHFLKLLYFLSRLGIRILFVPMEQSPGNKAGDVSLGGLVLDAQACGDLQVGLAVEGSGQGLIEAFPLVEFPLGLFGAGQVIEDVAGVLHEDLRHV